MLFKLMGTVLDSVELTNVLQLLAMFVSWWSGMRRGRRRSSPNKGVRNRKVRKATRTSNGQVRVRRRRIGLRLEVYF